MKATLNLTDQHLRDRLEFARLHMSWTHEWESLLLEGFTQRATILLKAKLRWRTSISARLNFSICISTPREYSSRSQKTQG
uniref:Uncharacterized protein n=1 Tax=Ditylenchus dipsaci TaxID=166011 RepID=A0A915EMU5_9BILA